ncbi:membrane protein [Bacteroidia bacterium]|nr:membrane protein [Bacteroidia bacterium]
MIRYFIKKYPFSIALLLLILYLSFFRPPSLDIPLFPGVDKVVHFCMYAGVTAVLWFEFFLNYRRKPSLPIRHALTGAVFCPILFGGLVELGQNFLTDYRGGEWFDFFCNTGGVAAGSLFAWFILRRWIIKK